MASMAWGQEKVSFKAGDGLEVVADLYKAHDQAPFIILFHQAGWSRGEYREIAPKLNEMGFNCMAVDQRSGGAVNNVSNETNANAKKENKKTKYADAIPDIEAAVSYVKENFNPDKLIIWGSSYSSALVLKVAGDNAGMVDAVMSFAPGEYFGSKDFISSSAKNLEIPVFITSAKSEKNNWWGIYEAIPSTKKSYYLPTTAGNHGSRALWNKFSDAGGYWSAVTEFLKSLEG